MIVHADLEASAVGRLQRQGFDFRLELFEQVGRQTDSPVGVVSNGAVNNLDFLEHDEPPARFNVKPRR